MTASCADRERVYIKDGNEYGLTSGFFRGKWWNYYERGVSFTEGGFYLQAAKDLKIAIKKRNNDQWRSRTYGMHFINYFPHRELGIIYHNLARYNEAVEELETSLQTAQSSKAKYFLNKARKAVLDKTGKDKFPPSLKIDSPLDGTITNKFAVTLTGNAEDDFFVSSISINTTPFPFELSAKNVRLKKEVPLQRGRNEIKIFASDLTGKTTEKIITVIVDRKGPLVAIEEQEIQGDKVIISGFISDSTGIRSFTINGKPVNIENNSRASGNGYDGDIGSEVKFRHEILLVKMAETIVLKAEDLAENMTIGELNIAPRIFNNKRYPRFHRYPKMNGFIRNASYRTVTGRTITDRNVNPRIPVKDNTPPFIKLENMPYAQTVPYDTLFLEGKVSDENKLQSLTINGESVLKRKGRVVFFNHLIGLKEGKNRFAIEAVDVFGNRAEKTVTVTRKIEKVRQIGSRMSISVLPLDSKGNKSMVGDIAYNGIISAIFNQKRFQVVEREKIEEVLRELKLSQTALVQPQTASKIGKLIVADTIMTGSIYERRNSIEISTRLINTETSAIMETHDVFGEDKSFQGMKTMMEGLALKYKRSFPMLEGVIIKTEGDSVLVDLGSENKIKNNMLFIIFRNGEEVIHPVSGRRYGIEPLELGKARVTNVYKKYSSAAVSKYKKVEKIKVKDKVITK